MLKIQNKRVIASITLIALSIISTSIPTLANAGSFSSGKSTLNSVDFNWGHPCNNYGPVGSFNLSGKRAVNPSGCSKWLSNGRTINPFEPINK